MIERCLPKQFALSKKHKFPLTSAGNNGSRGGFFLAMVTGSDFCPAEKVSPELKIDQPERTL